MFVIEAVNDKGWRWISAICLKPATAEAFLESVPAELRAMQKLVELPITAYPLFVVDENGFQYGGADLVRARLASVTPHGSEDYIHFNVYIVRDDFLPNRPGEDSMGDIYHWHITDWSLQPPRSEVIAEELLEAERRAV
ncbi:hypothetical protein [Ramlibacter sp. AN1133]|uniref:hypothetical protein n=1 Tax=Ramlibacter sp. AN1133 TaxID=3133429 RepID=UPI0030C0073F